MNKKSCDTIDNSASNFVNIPARLVLPPVGIFWDIENCQVPKGKSAAALVQRIREKSLGRYREAEFMCVCDVNKESKIVIRELNLSQVTVVHVCATCKNAADDKLKQCMRRFVDVHGAYSAVILISNDVNFVVDLSDFRYRYNIKVVLLHTDQVPKALLSLAHEHYDFFELACKLPFRSPTKFPSGPCELKVTNLPDDRNVNHIRNVLKRLSDNCGGRVQWISGTSAALRFQNAGAARRAQKRMDKEYVFGRQISVNFSQTSSISTTHIQEEVSSCFQGQKNLENEPVSDRRISLNFFQTPSTSSTQFPMLCTINRPMSVFPEIQEKHQNTEKYFSTLNNLWFLNREQLLSVASMVVRYLSDIESHNCLRAIQLPNTDPEGNTILKVMESTAKNSVLSQTSPSDVEMVVNVSVNTPTNHGSKRQRKQKNRSVLLNEVQTAPIVDIDLINFSSQKSRDVSVGIGKENRSKISMIKVNDSFSTRKKAGFPHLPVLSHSSGRKSRTSDGIGTTVVNKQIKPTENFENIVIQLFSTAEINTNANDDILSNDSGPSAKHILTDHFNSSIEEIARKPLRQQQQEDSSFLIKRQASPSLTSCAKRPRRNPMRKAKCKKNI